MGEVMNQFLKKLENCIDDCSIKKKLYILYICCLLLPLLLTDSMIVYIVAQSEKAASLHEMENISNAVKYNLINDIESTANLAKSIYMNQYIDSFLEYSYETPLDYVVGYQRFFKDTLFESGIGINNYMITLYSDNDTIVNGGTFSRLEEIRSTDWYQYLKESGETKFLCFSYDKNEQPAVDAERKIFFIQKLDFFSNTKKEKILKIEVDYSGFARGLVKMNYAMPVYICQGDRVLLSNEAGSSVKKDFERFEWEDRIGYAQTINLYGADLQLYVLKPDLKFFDILLRNLPVLLLLLLINIILPVVFIRRLNQSFTKRISELGEAFGRAGDEELAEISNVRGKDEIGALMNNYNTMVQRINSLIQIVYVNRIREQEMIVARKNAELLALHSQINPHFLFNALESIRMHSILKKEIETADMVEKLAVMQRQYVEWGEDMVEVVREMEFVEAYLSLQKYRFGDRLLYELSVEKGCEHYRIPKLTLVTFVENACVHGIEGKAKQGWIFVRIYRKDEELRLEVEDTGNGMTDADMQKLQEKMEYANIDMLKEKDRVGIVNACLRLKIATENKVCFRLDGELGIGLMVQIQIPQIDSLQERGEINDAEGIAGR